MDIEIYIDKIILDGFETMNRVQLSTAIQEKLTMLITEQGFANFLPQAAEIAKLSGGPIQIGNSQKPSSIGPQIAKGIYQGVKSIPK